MTGNKEPYPVSETTYEMSKTWELSRTAPQLFYRPIINFLSFRVTEKYKGGTGEEGGISLRPRGFGRTDYVSTMKRDFRWFSSRVPPKSLTPEVMYRVETKFRRRAEESEKENGTTDRREGPPPTPKPPYATDI